MKGKQPRFPNKYVVIGVTLLVGGTALSFNPGGLGEWADFASAWAGHLVAVVNGQPWYYPLLALILYEPGTLLFSVVGAVGL